MRKDKPVICIGWPTIARLAMGKTIVLENAILIPDDYLMNAAGQVRCEEARIAVDGIISDLHDRRELKSEWRAIGPDTQKQIGEAWERIVAGAGLGPR